MCSKHCQIFAVCYNLRSHNVSAISMLEDSVNSGKHKTLITKGGIPIIHSCNNTWIWYRLNTRASLSNRVCKLLLIVTPNVFLIKEKLVSQKSSKDVLRIRFLEWSSNSLTLILLEICSQLSSAKSDKTTPECLLIWKTLQMHCGMKVLRKVTCRIHTC